MRNLKRRVAAFALSLVLAVSYLPFSAFAAAGNTANAAQAGAAENNVSAAVEGTKGLIKDTSVSYTRYYFVEEDGTRVKFDWRTVEGKRYFFDPLGYSVRGWCTISGEKYYFDKNCHNVTGTQIIDNVVYTFDETGKLLINTQKGLHLDASGKYYYITDEKGTLAKSALIEHENEGYFFDSQGFSVSGRQEINSFIYIFDDNYKLKKGLCTDPQDAEKLFFITNSKGERLVNAWSTDAAAQYYFNDLGFAVKGWQGIDGAQYYFGNDFLPYKNGEFEIEGTNFKFDENGKLVTEVALGLQKNSDGKLFFVINASGLRAKNQWQIADGSAYYFGDDEFAVTGEQDIGGEKFIFDSEFKLKTGLCQDSAGNYFYIKDTSAQRVKNDFSPDAAARYYFDENGFAVKGWRQIGDYKYYFDESFLPVTGEKIIEDKKYNFDEQGRLVSEATLGLNFDEGTGKYIFVKDKLGLTAKNEWQKVDNAAYYFDAEGFSVTGKQIIGGEVFVFDEAFKLKTGICTDPENGNVFFIENLDGARAREKWQTANDAKYYFDKNGNALKGRQLLDEQVYIFGDDGKMQTGLCFDPLYNARPFYIDAKTGTRLINQWNGEGENRYYFIYNGYGARSWNYIGGELHYFYSNSKPATGTQLIEGKVYNFDQNGKVLSSAASGVYFDEKAPGGGKYYYIAPNTDAPAKNTWYSDKDKAYYFGADGYSVKGRQEIKGSVYNFADDFKLITGLCQDGDKLFYVKDLSAAKAKAEWIAIGNDGYYFGEDGYALKGRQVIENEVFVFGDDFKLVQGFQKDPQDEAKLFLIKDAKGTRVKAEWFTNTDGKKYYFAKDGYAVKGWQTIGDDTYYMDDDFQPVTGVQIIDGKQYKFGDDGKLTDAVKLGLQLDKDTGRYKFIISPVGDLAKNMWQIVNSEAYYFDAEGLSVKGRQVIDNKVYFFTNEYKLQLGLYVDELSEGGKTAFFINDINGKRATNEWKNVDGKNYYFGENTLAVKGRQIIDNKVYVFDDNFVAKTGLCEDEFAEGGKKLFYLSPTTGMHAKNMWIASSGAYFYMGEDGYSVSGTQVIGGITYVFTSDFTLKTGLYQDPNSGNRYRYIAPNTNTIYKGWLTLEGKKYYFDPLGLSVKGVCYIDGVKYEFDNNYQLIENTIVGSKGIDVSEFQGVIDWAAVKASGIEFAIIRAVHWPKGASYYQIDPYFYRNVMGAKAQGIKVGAYIYSYAFNFNEGVEEALFFVNSNEVKTLRANGVKFDLPVFMDYEDKRIIENTSSMAQRTDAIRGGMIALSQNNYYPGFYMNDNWSRNYVDTNSLLNEGYDFWLAHFDVPNHKWGDKPGLWQYTSTARINGISGNVDMNVMYKDYPSIINPGGDGSSGGGGNVSGQLTVYDLNTKTYITDSWNNIVAAIVENEVGSGLGATGADAMALYKVQAVAARTWLLYQKQVSTANPQVGIKAPRVAVMNAVTEVQNEVLTYNGSYINAAYGSASAPVTNSSANMSWGAYPYLTNVSSKYEPSGYIGQTRTLDADRMRSNVEKIAGAGSTNGLPYEQWLTNIEYDAYGYCTAITVAGKRVSGGKFYENCYGLLSPNFMLTNNGSGGKWTFVTNGNGHCVGLSQWGARNMVVQLIPYKQVLETYYPGAKVTLK